MPSHDEPILRTELPSLDHEFAAWLAGDATPASEPASALAHALERIRRQNQADPVPIARGGPTTSSDFASAIG